MRQMQGLRWRSVHVRLRALRVLFPLGVRVFVRQYAFACGLLAVRC
jgi:hypothetical protein